jgi:hypothetical protein
VALRICAHTPHFRFGLSQKSACIWEEITAETYNNDIFERETNSPADLEETSWQGCDQT